MMIHSKFEPDKSCECARPCVTVQYSADEVRGMFVDFFEGCQFEQYKIKTYVWDEPTTKVHAIVRNTTTQEVSEWAMDVETRVPYLIAKFPSVSARPTKHRPRKQGSALWRATKAWENR